MSLNLRHLRIFREVARRGSVSAAARAVFVSQPAATQAVAATERHFDATLFERTGSGMALTPAGATVEIRVARALELVRDGVAETRRGRPAGLRQDAPLSVAQLEALIAVVEHGRFGRAARAMNVAVPTLHRAARTLERRLGAPLFEQTSFGVQPTREGQRLATQAQLAFTELAQARAELAAMRGGSGGRSVIGAMPLARSSLVPAAVLEFISKHPAHAVSILDGAYESLLAALRVGQADVLIGALRGPAADGVLEEPLFEDPLALIVRAGHPLTRRGRAAGRSLATFPWVAPRAGSPLRRQFNDLFEGAGVPVPANPIECNSLVASRELLAGSDRIMLLSEYQVRQEIESGLLVALPHPAGRVVRTIGLTVRKNWRPTAEQTSLLEALRGVARRVVSPPTHGRRAPSRAAR